MHALMNTYNRLPVSFTHGEGAWLFDSDGNRYLDALAGIGVCSLGHAHPAVTQAIQEQAGKLLHTSNIYHIELQEKLADVLAGVASMEAMFFGNSGAEANEAAIKIARLYGHREKNIDNPAIIVTDGAFHGRTMATLTATGNRKIQAGFEPLVSGFVRAPFNDIASLGNIAHNNPNIVAVLLEPIQGESGVRCVSPDYLPQLRALCDQHGWLLMLDEVQSGNGRSGSYFNYLQHGLLPDVVTTAKGLGNGMPIGVCMARGKAAGLMHPGNHGTTFGGNPLACAAALAVVNTIVREKLADRAAALGERIRAGLRAAINNDTVQDIRGHGLMIGVELHQPCAELAREALHDGLLINVTADSVIRLLPPLIYSDQQADMLCEKLSRLINARQQT